MNQPVKKTKMGRERWGQFSMSLLGLVIFAAAIWALARVLEGHPFGEIFEEFASRSPLQILLALFITSCSYGVLTGYDFLGLRYLNKSLPILKFALASSLGFAFANNLGFFGGAGLRLRLFLKLGLSSFDVAKLITFSAVTFWMGFATLGSVLFLFHPPQPSPESWLTPTILTQLGYGLGVVLVAYLVQGRETWRDVRFRARLFVFPSVRIRLGQMGVSSLDWMLASSVLFVLLPSGLAVSYPTVLAAFLCAQLLGLASNVPGGLGVFETVLLYVLPVEPEFESAVIASLLLFRLIYFVVPLILATLSMGLIEVRHHVSAARGYVMAKRVSPKPR
jgi:uncharacterized membrane protein YbhN (UPF0104 family)